MAISERVYKATDKPMSWTRAILLGTVVFALAIVLLGQAPSWIIYTFDAQISTIIDFSKKVPGVNKEGLNSTQVMIIRDIVANTVQTGFLIAALVGAYIWQEKKRKRTGTKGLQDVVKGYMPGK